MPALASRPNPDGHQPAHDVVAGQGPPRASALAASATLVAVVGVLGLAAQPARGAEPSTKLVPVYAGLVVRGEVSPEAISVLRTELTNQFRGRGAKAVVAGQDAISAEARSRALAGLDSRLADAAEAFSQNDFGAARAAALEALGLFESELAYLDDDTGWARYRSLLVLVADAQLSQGDVAGADKTVGQLLAVEPEWQPGQVGGERPVSEALQARVAELQQRQQKAALSMLELQSRPPGASTLVDGRAAGKAPVAVEVPPGIHYVVMEDAGRQHRERVSLTSSPVRVSVELASPELHSAEILRSATVGGIAKDEFTRLSWDVADVTVTAVVVPYGHTVQIVCARVTRGELDAVVGTRLPATPSLREKAIFQVVDAALTQKADGWVGGVDDDDSALRAAFLAGVGDPQAVYVEPTESELSVPLVVGGIIGGVVAIAGASLGIYAYVASEQEKDQGFRYGVDVSKL